MIRTEDIFGCLIISALSVFFLFGDVDAFFWARYDLIIQSLVVVYLITTKQYLPQSKLRPILFNIILGIAVFKIMLGAYSLIDAEVFNKINRSFWIGGIIVTTIIVFLRYKIYGLVKR